MNEMRSGYDKRMAELTGANQQYQAQNQQLYDQVNAGAERLRALETKDMEPGQLDLYNVQAELATTQAQLQGMQGELQDVNAERENAKRREGFLTVFEELGLPREYLEANANSMPEAMQSAKNWIGNLKARATAAPVAAQPVSQQPATGVTSGDVTDRLNSGELNAMSPDFEKALNEVLSTPSWQQQNR